MTVPIHLVAGSDDDLLDQPFLRGVARSYPHASLSQWPQVEHELPLTHPSACVAEIEQLRASVVGPAG